LAKPPENQASIDVRKGMPPRKLDRASFQEQFLSAFIDPSFDPLPREPKTVADAAWVAYFEQPEISVDPQRGTRIHHPDYELAVDWLGARDAIRQAEPDHTRGPARILLVNGSWVQCRRHGAWWKSRDRRRGLSCRASALPLACCWPELTLTFTAPLCETRPPTSKPLPPS
jgi:hypothetical protein